jgi:hypothetical protein
MVYSIIRRKAIFNTSQNLTFLPANEKWMFGSFRYFERWGPLIANMVGSTDYGYTALVQHLPEHDLVVVLLLNAYDKKYSNATHHALSKNHILPIILKWNEK